MNLYQIEQAYLQGKDTLEINELYQSQIADISDEQKIWLEPILKKLVSTIKNRKYAHHFWNKIYWEDY